jgi:hypothetical protein
MSYKYIYIAAIVILIAAFNLTLIEVVKGRQGWTYSVGILIALLALIAFRNRTLKLNKNNSLILACGLFGIALTIVNVLVAGIYAIIGLVLLVITQMIILSHSKPLWILIGGNPLQKLNDKETKVAAIGLAMILSVALTFFIKVLWLSNSV